MTFTERTGHLEDNPFFFLMDQIVLGIRPDDKRKAKNFASGLIVPGDLPDDLKIRGFFRMVHCNGLPAQMVTL
jgi:hypothetical protein